MRQEGSPFAKLELVEVFEGQVESPLSRLGVDARPKFFLGV